jgi:nickel/cobalt exporter
MSLRKLKALFAAACIMGALLVSLVPRPGTVSAHPLGNFTISTAARIGLYSDAIRLHYTVDMAEIPAFQEKGRIDRDGDGAISEAESAHYLAAKSAVLIANLRLTANARSLEMRLVDQRLALVPGEGGLETLRIDLLLEAPAAAGTLEFTDANYGDRLGWREVTVVAGAGVPLLSSTAPAESPTGGLARYPSDPAAPPLRMTGAQFAYTPGVGATAAASGLNAISSTAASTPASGLTSLLDGRPLTLTVVLLMLVVAMGFGAVHALEPGHGKTIVAAYFVGARGRVAHAALLGLIVAVTHSAGVLVIGAVTLYGSRYILPEQLYPWLTLLSGTMVVALGIALLISRLSAHHFLRHLVVGHIIPHRHTHDHSHPIDHSHPHPQAESSLQAFTSRSRESRHQGAAAPVKTLIVLGLIDGLIPTPSTLVVLLSAISLGKFALGLGLIVAFSVGLAAVLSSISLVTILLKSLLGRFSAGRGAGSRLSPLANGFARTAPAIAAVLLIGVGSVVILRASMATLLG